MKLLKALPTSSRRPGRKAIFETAHEYEVFYVNEEHGGADEVRDALTWLRDWPGSDEGLLITPVKDQLRYSTRVGGRDVLAPGGRGRARRYPPRARITELPPSPSSALLRRGRLRRGRVRRRRRTVFLFRRRHTSQRGKGPKDLADPFSTSTITSGQRRRKASTSVVSRLSRHHRQGHQALCLPCSVDSRI
jgi:hypothetical protein